METSRSFSCSSSGFNLIEAAVVLAVIGLVVGGIWFAAAAVSDNYKLSEAQLGLLQMVDSVQRNVPVSMYPSTSSWAIPNATIIAMDLGPAAWISNNQYYVPYGGGALIMLLYASDTLPSPSVPVQPTFRLSFNVKTGAQANRLIRALNASAAKLGMVYAFCGPAGTSTIDWGQVILSTGFPTCTANATGTSLRLFFSSGTGR